MGLVSVSGVGGAAAMFGSALSGLANVAALLGVVGGIFLAEV